jgi:hypothetical protein
MSEKFHDVMCPSAVLAAAISESFDHRNEEVFVALPHHLAGSAVKLSLHGADTSGSVVIIGIEATVMSSSRLMRTVFPRCASKSRSSGEKESCVYVLVLGAFELTANVFARRGVVSPVSAT